MKKLFLTASLALALGIGVNAQTVVPMLPSSHGLTTNQPAYSAQQEQTQEITLAAGWNWWSSYVDLSEDGLSNLQSTLGSTATAVKSQSQIIYYSSGIWEGTLTSLSNDKMYMIQTNTAPGEALEFTAAPLALADVDITTGSGWTWVGFPSNANISLEDALANYTASEGASIKSQGQVSYYSDGAWDGTLTVLEAGKGYMIQGTAQTFNYAPSASRGEEIIETPNTYWTASHHDFPNNMNILASINLMGEEIQGSDYEVAAFVGNDCRGTVNPQYVGSANKNIAFMTISGENGDQLQFRLRDNQTGDVYLASNTYTYSNDELIGSPKNPYVLYFNTLASSNELATRIDMFPNPVKQNGMLKIAVPNVSKNMKVQVINSLGVIVKNENMSSEVMNMSASFVPGVYTVKIVAGDNQLFVEKLIVE